MKKKVIKAEEEIILDAPVVRINDCSFEKLNKDDFGKFTIQIMGTHINPLRRLWNLLTCTIRYLVFGVWRL